MGKSKIKKIKTPLRLIGDTPDCSSNPEK